MEDSILLRVLFSESNVRLLGKKAGPVPTISIQAGEYLLIEVDPSDVSGPVSVEIDQLQQADTDLRDLFGSSLVNKLLEASADDSSRIEVEFVPTDIWQGLARIATQRWNERWNVFPMDPSMMAVDLALGANRAGPFGIETWVLSAQEMGHALEDLKELESQGRLDEQTTRTLERVFGNEFRPLTRSVSTETLDREEGTPLDLGMVAASRLVTSTSSGAIVADFARSEAAEVTALNGTADWRLTGMGMASTAEDAVNAEYVDAEKSSVRISVPAQEAIPESGRDDEPYYQGIVTDVANGEIIAFARLTLNREGDRFEGISPVARPLKYTDVVDIRHPQLTESVQKSLGVRRVDRIRRSAARAFAFERLVAASGSYTGGSSALAKAWEIVGKEVASVQKDYPEYVGGLRGWIPLSDAYRHRALKASLRRAEQQRATQIEEDYEGSVLPDLSERTMASPLLSERQFVGTLAVRAVNGA